MVCNPLTPLAYELFKCTGIKIPQIMGSKKLSRGQQTFQEKLDKLIPHLGCKPCYGNYL